VSAESCTQIIEEESDIVTNLGHLLAEVLKCTGRSSVEGINRFLAGLTNPGSGCDYPILDKHFIFEVICEIVNTIHIALNTKYIYIHTTRADLKNKSLSISIYTHTHM
jgi:hypothetical protein